MSPGQLDDDVVGAKLAAIHRARQTLHAVGEVDGERLRGDAIVAAAVERLLCRMVELAVDTNSHIAAAVLRRSPADYRESFDFLHEAGALTRALADELKPSVGLRNAIVHEYLDVDYDIVAASAPMALAMYGDYVRQVAGFVHDRTVG